MTAHERAFSLPPITNPDYNTTLRFQVRDLLVSYCPNWDGDEALDELILFLRAAITREFKTLLLESIT